MLFINISALNCYDSRTIKIKFPNTVINIVGVLGKKIYKCIGYKILKIDFLKNI